jgi:GT2 family glycosyltransferase
MSRFVVPPPPEPVETGETPSFSVIIAAYQAADTIGEAVESALSQTRPPQEVIVCDDGSTDDIEDAVASYRRRIVFLRKENGGEASAKNAAARAAAGDFVVILDADDVFLSERLEALSELALERPDLDILTTDAYLELDGTVVRTCYTDTYRFVADDQRRGILRENFIFGHAAVRRERLLAVGGFDESIRWTTDWDCWLRMILAGSRAGLVDEPLSRYRLHPGSLSSQREAHIRGRLMTLAKAAHRADLNDAERGVLRSAIGFNERALRVARARAALLERRPDARRRSLDLVLGSGHGLRTRMKALATVLAPSFARRRLAAKPRETTGGIMLPPLAEDDSL